MAAEPTKAEVKEENQPTPKSALTNGEKDGRGVHTPTVGVTENRSFDERTGVRQPFVLDDGTQDNGAKDLDAQEGASAQSTRKDNNTAVEDTKTAIDKGLLPASDQPDVKDEPVRNPVK